LAHHRMGMDEALGAAALAPKILHAHYRRGGRVCQNSLI
jgi:hypothetical protein